MRSCLLLLCLSIGQLARAQSSLPAFGEFSREEIDMKECAFDKKAGAVILFDDAVSDHDNEYHLITRRRVRIKIFSQLEIDRGNIRIPFYSKDKFQYIRNIKAVSYTAEGDKIVKKALDNKSIFTEKENAITSSIRFALPNVKPGSIIEYMYESNMKHYGGLKHWIFQQELPVVRSSYLLTLLPNTEFSYSVQKKPGYPITIKPMNDAGKIYFEMNNLPGLKFEPYMDAVSDYLQKVEFQLAGYLGAFGNKTKVNQTWYDLGNDLLNDKNFGGVIKKNLSKIDDLKSIVATELTDSGKIAAVYNYVRNNFTWNGYYSKYAMEGLNKVWENRTGNAGEINLLLINLLKTFDLDVVPLLVAERDFGKIDTSYPFLDRFSKVAVYARADGKIYIMDATKKNSPHGLTPFPLLNTIAFVVEKKNFRLIRIVNNRRAYTNRVSVEATVDSNGLLSGKGKITSSAYAKQVRTQKIKTDPKAFVKEILQEPGSELMIANVTYDNMDEQAGPLVQQFDFHSDLNSSGGFIFLGYNLFMGLGKNPFTADERFTNVNFGYPYDVKLEANFHLPGKSKPDKLPPDKMITSQDKMISLSRKLKVENNILSITIEFIQNTTLVAFEAYDELKSFYTQMMGLLSEPVIIKINN